MEEALARELFVRAIELTQIGSLGEAQKLYEKLLRAFPGRESVVLNFSSLLIQTERYGEALGVIDEYLRSKGSPTGRILLNRGTSLHLLGEVEAALGVLQDALRLGAPAEMQLASCLLDNEQLTAAEEMVQAALKKSPGEGAWLNLAGRLYSLMGNFHLADASFKAGLLANPEDIDMVINYARFKHLSLSDHVGAKLLLTEALRKTPNNPSLLFNVALLHDRNQDFHLAEQSYRALLALQDHPEAHKNLGLILLSKLKFTEAWHHNRWRRWDKRREDAPLGPLLPWISDSLPMAEEILLLPEQGIGDQILYLSMLHDLNRLNRKITCGVDIRLVKGLHRIFPDINFVRIEDALKNAHSFKNKVFIGDLGFYLRSNHESFKSHAQFPWLGVDQELANRISQKLQSLGQGKPVVGLAWASMNKELHQAKSIPAEIFVKTMEQHPDIQFVSLQFGNPSDIAKQHPEIWHQPNLVRDVGIDLMNDLDGVLSLISACDTLITTSNSVAHLAGALLKRTIVLIPKRPAPFFYWSAREGARPIWYPSHTVIECSPTDSSHCSDRLSELLGQTTHRLTV